MNSGFADEASRTSVPSCTLTVSTGTDSPGATVTLSTSCKPASSSGCMTETVTPASASGISSSACSNREDRAALLTRTSAVSVISLVSTGVSACVSPICRTIHCSAPLDADADRSVLSASTVCTASAVPSGSGWGLSTVTRRCSCASS